MAAHTDAPDDLIAELARLMADDARDNQPPPPSQPPATVRIPGDATGAPVPRFDFSASASMASSKAPASPVRIPGGERAPANTRAPAEAAEPFAFHFDLGPSPRPAAATPDLPRPASPAPAAPAIAVAPPVVAEPQAELDQDSLADLIAAELAADMGPDLSPEAESAPGPNLASRSSDPDSFGVPPVFGLGSVPAASVAASPPPMQVAEPAPVVEEPIAAVAPRSRDDDTSDPLDEIERLVGPSVRMNATSSAPAPALRSLATPVAPAVAAPEPVRIEPTPRVVAPAASANSVDEAILAAAAATGAHVEWVNAGASEADGPAAEAEEAYAPPRRRGFGVNRAVAGPLVAVSLLAAAGFGLYWVLGQGGTTTGPAPLVVADTTPTKEVPEVETPAAAQQSVVFNEMSGETAVAEEQIVSRDQADTEAVVAANTQVASSGVLNSELAAEVDPNQDGLVNRKVRTVTVRPDGTIVSGNDSLAGSAILPVDRPDVPEVPGADTSTPDLIATAIAETEAAAAAETVVAVVPPAETPAAGTAAEPGATIAVVDTAGAELAGRTVTVPMQRPADFATIANAAIASASAAPAAMPEPSPVDALAPVAAAQPVVAATAAGSAAAYVQLASQRSEAEAQATVQAINTRYGVLFGGATPEIRRVDLGERGIFYRVLVPATSREGATNICDNVKAAGGDCLVQ